MTTVAIVHDYLTQRGGAERVVLALHEAFPDAPIHTALFDPSQTYAEFSDADVRPSVLDRSERLRHSHRLAFPLLAPVFTGLRVDADVVVCSSSGWAHGVRTDGRKLVYCYTPARWLYQTDRYLRTAAAATRASVRVAGPPLRQWDRSRARSADGYAGISTVVVQRIQAQYGIDASLIHPPVRVDHAGPQRAVEDVQPGFDLCVSRLLAYKNVDALVQASASLPGHRLVIVGDGPDAERLRSLAHPGVVFLPRVDEDELRWLYGSCRYLLSASHEDFGLTPLEAAGFGKPSVVLAFGGFRDTVLDGVTGVFFDEVDPLEVAAAIRRAEEIAWDDRRIAAHVDRFSSQVFFDRVQKWVGVPITAGGGASTTIEPS